MRLVLALTISIHVIDSFFRSLLYEHWRRDYFWLARDPLEAGGDCSDWRLHCEHGAEPSFAVRNALVSFRSFGQWIGLND